MEIGKRDGVIAFQHGIVEPDMDRIAFLASSLGRTARQELINSEWWHLHLKPETGIAANVLYKGDRLHQVYILMTIPSDNIGEWTMGRELERKNLHDEWLRREAGQSPLHVRLGFHRIGIRCQGMCK